MTKVFELSALLASQAAAEALTSGDKLGHKLSVTVLDRNGVTRAVLKHERATPHTLDSSRGKAYQPVVKASGSAIPEDLVWAVPSVLSRAWPWANAGSDRSRCGSRRAICRRVRGTRSTNG